MLSISSVTYALPTLTKKWMQQNESKIRVFSFKDQLSHFKGRKRASHEIHAYPAKLIPHIPYYFINNPNYTSEDSTIADFFCGSGTVLVEASLAGHKSYGMDVNPLSILISKVKTTPLSNPVLEKQIEKLMRKINDGNTASIPDFPNRDFWFTKTAVKKLSMLKEIIDTSDFDKDCENFFNVCLSSIVRACSNADPRISPPVFSKRMKEYKLQGRRVDVVKTFEEALKRNTVRMQSFSKLVHQELSHVSQVDSRKINSSKMFDVVITSPPYVDAQKYMRSSKLELYWLGLNQKKYIALDRQSIGTENISIPRHYRSKSKVYEISQLLEEILSLNPKRAFVLEKYLQDMDQVLNSIYRSLKKNGHFILIIGNNKMSGLRIPLDLCITKIAENIGFEWNETLIDPIKSRGFMTKRIKTNLMDSERIIVFQK